ncbi:MAG: hypothetical protein H8D45_08055 [Bacteroidetes bacterium]|nr:hypothetical protein [Bacteroidota bacterium]
MENNYKYPIIADNYYELLGFKPFCIINTDELNNAFEERYKYWKLLISPENMIDKSAAMDELFKARKTLLNTEEKKRYDILLRRRLYSLLSNIADLMLKLLLESGNKFGLTEEEIQETINNCLKRELTTKFKSK